MAVKSFIGLDGVNAMNLFSSSLTKRSNKLECLSLTSLCSLSLMRWSKASGLTRKHSTRLKRLAGDKHSSLFVVGVRENEKKVI
jgi:hypothetical protein